MGKHPTALMPERTGVAPLPEARLTNGGIPIVLSDDGVFVVSPTTRRPLLSRVIVRRIVRVLTLATSP
jgi:hypothetical protein